MATWADVEARGYAVPVSAEGIRCVSREGFVAYVREDDQATIDALANPTSDPAVEEAAAVTVAPQLDPKTATLVDVIAAVNALIG